MRAELTPVEPWHIESLCAGLRAREREAFDLIRCDPVKMLSTEVDKSLITFAGVYGGEVLAIGGVLCNDIFADTAYAWMVCGACAERLPIPFIRGALRAYAKVAPGFKTLYGFVDPSFDKSIAWLTWMGAQTQLVNHGFVLFWWGEHPRV